ncbi:hypothetical protein L596_030940 [Steinernema carpocapsae]|uniref:RED-like N-terminal domain-containing protein n=1 Tax=Steinernema carpocapsae TaxID=34508 RepID=A0A4U5MHD2_STECR|nr:hypothetical protein L596_030940 [Steinernema carpocapsae]
MDDEWNQFVNETGGSSSNKPAHLRNEDFRKLLGSTRQQSHSAAPATHSFTHRHHGGQEKQKQSSASAKKERQKRFREKQQERKDREARKEEEEDDSRLTEILKNYRDRAAERRKGDAKDDRSVDSLLALNGAYKAVPGDPREAADAALRRQQAIEESKYLGGDIEHTHLVKGLDYSLLNKVRSEIAHRGDEEDEEMEAIIEEKAEEADKPVEKLKEKLPENKMVRNLHNLINKPEYPKRNDLFARGRMAYIVELEDEEAELPTTLVRSIQDCPVDQTPENINANNMLIQKLTQVLSYLRTDSKKKKKTDNINMTEEERKAYAEVDIYDDVGDYVPTSKDQSKASSSSQSKDKPSSYFESSNREKDDRKDCDEDRNRRRDRDRDRDHDRENRERDRDRHHDRSRHDRDRDRDRRDRDRERDDKANGSSRKSNAFGVPSSSTEKEKPKRRRPDSDDDDAYAELFPSGIGLLQAGYESDEDADFSKMDLGNKKGPLKRWDFETQEEYEKYLGSQEALPKAAFQYGVKTNEGRKTRKNNAQEEKQKFDKEYNQIMKHMEKRKADETDGKASKRVRY